MNKNIEGLLIVLLMLLLFLTLPFFLSLITGHPVMWNDKPIFNWWR